MSVTRKSDSHFEFVEKYNILINHVNTKYNDSPSSYILDLTRFIKEADRLKADRLLVIASSEVFNLNMRMYEWISSYLFPQMKHSGIKKIGFCASTKSDSVTRHKAIFGIDPEVGVFTSMPEAKAWVLDLTEQMASLSIDIIEQELNGQLAS